MTGNMRPFTSGSSYVACAREHRVTIIWVMYWFSRAFLCLCVLDESMQHRAKLVRFKLTQLASLKQGGPLFADNFFEIILFNENWCILIPVPLKYVPKIDKKPAMVQIMAWWRSNGGLVCLWWHHSSVVTFRITGNSTGFNRLFQRTTMITWTLPITNTL